MTKGQSVIMQFLIFFIIGFFIFITIGMFFKYQSDLFKQDIISSSLNLTNSYLSSVSIIMVDDCKECDFINLTLKVSNTSTGYPIEVKFTGNSMLNTSIPTVSEQTTTIHNLNYSLKASGSSSSVKTIILTFNRTNNNLGVK